MTKDEFGKYCLRKLGDGMIVINVTPEQVNDRIDDAYNQFLEKHYDAFEAEWVAHKITDADVANGFITTPVNTQIVDGIIYMNVLQSAGSTANAEPQFSYQYQMMLPTMVGSPWGGFDAISYYLQMLSLNETKDLIGLMPRFEYTHRKQKLVIYDGAKLKKNEVVFYHKKSNIPQDELYADNWFRKYATACIKEQWGSNLKKHQGIQTLGGVTVNGQQIYDEAIQEKENLETILIEQYEIPPMFIVG